METIMLILSREGVSSVTITKDTINIVSKTGSHKYTIGYFNENVLPKLTKGQSK